MLPLGGYQTANPMRDRFIVAFPLKPSEDPSIRGGVTALFQNEAGIYYVVDDPPLFGAWPLRLIEQEYERTKSLQPTELTSEQVAARWIVSYLRFLCPHALDDANQSEIGPNFDP
jgi:hypothetical protein